MSRDPSIDELIGTETTGAERERLRRVHELLLEAGPPPELPPELRSVPDFAVVRRRERRALKRRAFLLLAAALAVVIAFAAGYAVAHRGSGAAAPSKTLALRGTAAAPKARATLELLPARAGNWPMTLSVVGLPKLPPHDVYDVYLVRDGKPWASCGTFTVSGSSGTVTVTLNAPYRLRSGDSWLVTRENPGGRGRTAVLRQA